LDAQLLANRIALLKQEEEKAWKKIEETKKRAVQKRQHRPIVSQHGSHSWYGQSSP